MTRSSQNAQRAEEAAWDADVLRLTRLCPPGPAINVDGWWNRLVGADPDSANTQPKAGIQAVAGRYDDWPLALQVLQREGRIDWIAGGLGESVNNPDAAPFPQRLSSFMEIMRRWLTEVDLPTNRLALGMVCMLDINSVREGYQKISDYLDFDVNADVSSDFHYQINKRRESIVVPGMWVNRLMQWSVASFHEKALVISAGAGIAASETAAPRYFLRLELDINTAPETSQLPSDRLAALLEEFAEWAGQIIREGEIQ